MPGAQSESGQSRTADRLSSLLLRADSPALARLCAALPIVISAAAASLAALFIGCGLSFGEFLAVGMIGFVISAPLVWLNGDVIQSSVRNAIALAEREARLRAILDSEPECVKTVDGDCRLIDMNLNGLKMIEAESLAAVQGRSVLDLVDEADRQLFREGARRVFLGDSVTQRFRMTGLKGTKRFMEQRAVPLREVRNPSRIVAMLAVTRDITDQVRTQDNLTKVAQDLRAAQRIGNMGSWIWDISSGKLDWSEQLYKIYGYEPGEAVDSFGRLLDLIHPEDREGVKEAVRRTIEDGAPFDNFRRIVRRDGQIRIMHTLGEVERNAQGEPVRMVGTAQDVTDLYEAQEKLRQSEAALAGILRISPEGIVVSDAGGRIKIFSAGAEEIFGYKAEEVTGQSIELLMPARFRVHHGQHIRSFASSNESSRRMGDRSEISGLRRNGEEFPAEASLSKIQTPAGLMFTTIIRDVSRQKAIHEELLMAKLRAEAASESKSRFLANMSHELRTPLNAINGFSSLLLMDQGGRVSAEKRREYLGDINRSGEHLLQIINDILELSSIEIGKVQLVEDVIRLNELIDRSARMVRLRAEQAGIELTSRVPRDLPEIRADLRLATQVILNLLTNALKFTNRGGRVEVTAALSGDGELSISVQDNGIGMSAEDAKRVGEPFLQLDSRLTRKYEGTGLGLSIVKRIMHLHGGRMEIISSLGVGTKVSVVFPASRTMPVAKLLKQA